jgi:hypothetical protein
MQGFLNQQNPLAHATFVCQEHSKARTGRLFVPCVPLDLIQHSKELLAVPLALLTLGQSRDHIQMLVVPAMLDLLSS